MIQSIVITNYLGESTTLEMGFPERSGFSILGVEGLGPAKADINMTDLVTTDGSLFNSSRVGSRNILMNLGFIETPTIEEIRHKSYRIFPIKKPLTFTVNTELRSVITTGYVESNEPYIFSNASGTSISIQCPTSYFYSKKITTTLFSGVDLNFQFPFSNESLTQKLIKFGTLTSNTEKNVYYEGDAEVGLVMTINAVGTVVDLNIYNEGTREAMKINHARLVALTGSGIITGDEIIINTQSSSKSITLIRNGVITNILNTLDRDADWFSLTRGDNVFAYTATSGAGNLQFKIENATVFEGV